MALPLLPNTVLPFTKATSPAPSCRHLWDEKAPEGSAQSGPPRLLPRASLWNRVLQLVFCGLLICGGQGPQALGHPHWEGFRGHLQVNSKEEGLRCWQETPAFCFKG